MGRADGIPDAGNGPAVPAPIQAVEATVQPESETAVRKLPGQRPRGRQTAAIPAPAPFPSRRGAATAILLLLALPPWARADEWVTVKAWARPDYAAQRAAHPSQRRHYVVAKGEYFPGFCRDPSIEKASFMGIVEKLAADLSKQGYFPAQAMDQADELVVVHWGTTIPFVSEYANEAVDNPNYYTPHAEDFGGIDSGLQDSLREIYNNRSLARAADAQALDQAAHALTSRSLAGLLGYASDLAELGKTPARDVEERMLLANLSEERYFIIVMSFDLHDLLEDHHRAILWTEHMSMRAPGTNFSTALVSMSRMAGPLAGRSIDHIMTDRSPAGGPVGQVEIGPIRVLGMGAAAAPAK